MINEDDANNNCGDVVENVSRKRKSSTNSNGNSTENQNTKRINQTNNNHPNEEQEDKDGMLALSLAIRPTKPTRELPEEESSPLPSESLESLSVAMPSLETSLSESMPELQHQLQLPPTHTIYVSTFVKDTQNLSVCCLQEPATQRQYRLRRNPTQAPGEGKGDTVPALFPWSTTKRATVQSFDYLVSKNITSISGDVHCRKCEKKYKMEYDLLEKFLEVWRFIADNKSSMHDRAPNVWMNPVLPTCRFCRQENCARPVIPLKKKQMNWLFLLLGQLLGCCTLDQLKYFCKHTKNHRTGAKDRVLYLTYLGLCKQLDPTGPFDR
ncbi:uncharacterized protein LOC123214283 [Mangifera indica]|uniref:uncharacterized protein LOC123214283 n=1 Tax=Mangifera indica TaxID=29780 RepID=UPI001CFB091F|nr:uncharacterized protein LOC123214283 [Mangifera indica]